MNYVGMLFVFFAGWVTGWLLARHGKAVLRRDLEAARTAHGDARRQLDNLSVAFKDLAAKIKARL